MNKSNNNHVPQGEEKSVSSYSDMYQKLHNILYNSVKWPVMNATVSILSMHIDI